MIARVIRLLNFKKERLHLGDCLLMGIVGLSLLSPTRTVQHRIYKP